MSSSFSKGFKIGCGIFAGLFILCFVSCIACTALIGTAVQESQKTINRPGFQEEKADTPNITATATAKPSNEDPSASPVPTGNESPSYKVGEEFTVGYWKYKVNRVGFSKQLPNGNQANGIFFWSNITVTNMAKDASSLSAPKAIDTSGNECDADIVNSDLFLEHLNPGVSKTGNIVFDVQSGKQYVLELAGGFQSTEKAIVK